MKSFQHNYTYIISEGNVRGDGLINLWFSYLLVPYSKKDVFEHIKNWMICEKEWQLECDTSASPGVKFWAATSLKAQFDLYGKLDDIEEAALALAHSASYETPDLEFQFTASFYLHKATQEFVDHFASLNQLAQKRDDV